MSLDSFEAALADRYRIERELGAGGMATVYLAEDLKHDRKVAIKVLKPELAAVLGAERFVQEIKTTAALNHPHILPLFDSGSADGQLYYVMPYIDGETIREKLDRETQVGIDEAVRITTEVADALEYAHHRGVIHRDIKPENILLHDGRPRVMDFGIALAVSAAAGGRMTETGLSLGTPHYMSPEQATAEKEISGRSDIYSLASVLYEMLTGDPPHTGSSAQQIIMKIVTEDPPPVTKLRKSVPPNVAAALGKALEKLPADRFESARAFSTALTDPHYTGPIASIGSAATPWKTGAVGAGAAALVFAALAAWGWSRPAPAAPSNVAWRIPLAIPDSEAPVDDDLAISRDGATIVYVGTRQLYRLTAATGRAEPIPGTRGGSSPGLSPDGRRVAYYRAGTVIVQSLDGGGRMSLAAGIGGSAVWLDDDHLLLANGNAGLLIVPTNGAPPMRRDSGLVVNATAPLPSGDAVLFTSVDTRSDSLQSWIGAVDLHGGTPVRLTRGIRARFVAPDRLIVHLEDGSIAAFPFDPKHLRITGTATPVAHGSSFDVAATGRMVYLESHRSLPRSAQTVWVDRRGNVTPSESDWPGMLSSIAIAPDGSRIAAVVRTPRASQSNEIQVRDITTGATSRITSGAYLLELAWAPDGRTLFYTAALPSRFGIYRAVPGSAAAPTQVLRRPGDSAVSAAIPSADGRTLYFNQGSGNAMVGDIRSIPIADSARVRVEVAAPASTPAPSPDGRWLAYRTGGRFDTLVVRSTDSGRSEIWVVAPRVQGLARWSRDGKALYFIARDSMCVATVAPGAEFRIASVQALFPLGKLERLFDVAPDGRFAMVRPIADSTAASAATNRLVMIENWATKTP